MNKNISVWRGDKTPPTKYHLWQKEDGTIYINIEDEWKSLASINSIPQLKQLTDTLNRIKDIELVQVDPSNNNTLKSYRLKSGENYFGITIDIPKDRAIKDIKLGYEDASVNSESGEITIGTGDNPQYMIYSIALEDGSYKMISIDLSQFITEKEYGQGLELVDKSLQVKIDSSSDSQLSVSHEGIKLNGVQSKFDSLDSDIQGINTAIYSQFLTLTYWLSPDIIEINTDIKAILTFKYCGEIIQPDTIKCVAGFKNIEVQQENNESYTLNYTTNSNINIKVTWTYRGITKIDYIDLNIQNPWYIGFGNNVSELMVNSNKQFLSQIYNFKSLIAQQNNHLYIIYNSDISNPIIKINGIVVPGSTTIDDTGNWRIFTSSSTFNAGQILLEIIIF